MIFLQPSASSKSLGYQAYEAIRDAIITLQLKPGQAIMEAELAELLQISRTPIREALQLLIAEQLIHVLPQRTKIVSYISDVKVKESAFVRLSLEQSAFQLVAQQWNSSELRYQKAEKQLLSLLAQQTEAADEHQVARFLELDEQFHRHILQLAGNETLLEVIYHMCGYLNRFRFLAMHSFLSPKQVVEEHTALLQALIDGNSSGLVGILQQHLGKLEQEIPLLKQNYGDYFLK